MRKVLGSLVLLAGVGGLGWYASQDTARAIEAQVAQAAADVVGTAPHGVSAIVSGRDITVSGTVTDTAAQDALLAALDAIPGRRVVNADALEMLPVASPFLLSLKKDDAGVVAAGNVPSATAADELGLPGLTVASGAPADWQEAVRVTLAALGPLETAQLVLSDQNIAVSGVAKTPVERDAVDAALSALPDGYQALTDIETLDDGTPLRLSLAYDGETLTGSGKIPADLATGEIAIAGADLQVDLLESPFAASDAGWPTAAQAGIAALAALGTGELTLDGQSGSLTGASSPDAIAAAQAALADLPDGFEIAADLTLFDDGNPFALTVEKTADGLTGAGKVPADFDGPDGLADVAVAFIADDSGVWPGIADAGLAALDILEAGQVVIADGAITLTGEALTPVERDAAVAALAGYDATTDLTLLDDGAPFALNLIYEVDTGAAVSGKLPADVALSDVAGALDLDVADDGLVGSVLTSDTDFVAPLSGLGDLLPDVAALTYASDENGTTVQADAAPGVDAAALTAAFQAALGDAALIAVEPSAVVLPEPVVAPVETAELPTEEPAVQPEEAAELPAEEPAAAPEETAELPVEEPAVQPEVTAELPAQEPVEAPDVTAELPVEEPVAVPEETAALQADEPAAAPAEPGPTPATCAAEAQAILVDESVQFVSSSAELLPESLGAIDGISALARKCAVEGGVFLRVAGHTDSTGDPAGNLALSEARANAVRDAILERGLARAVVTAVGFGDTQPLADNSTPEGRAANRRTEFIWSFE